jgi:hypothetical protein
MWDALIAFATDPGYLTDMVEAANELDALKCPHCGRQFMARNGFAGHMKAHS